MTELAIRPLVAVNLPAIAALHDVAFASSALTRLGTEAVRRYYEWLLEGPHEATNLGAFTGTRLVGFCFGGVFNGAMTGFLRRNRVYLASRVLSRPWLIASPLFRERIGTARRLLFRARAAAPAPPRPHVFGILAIATDPALQGTGIGKAIMARAEELARERGFPRMQLTVARTNAQAIAFYRARGWTEVVDASGAWTGGMQKPLI